MKTLDIYLITPASPGSRSGNRVTAERWAGLRDLGHAVTLEQEWDGCPCDLLIALHSRHSFPSVDHFRRRPPGSPLIVTLTGTDLYADLGESPEAGASLEAAWRIMALQPAALESLPPELRAKTRVILQSVSRRPQPSQPSRNRTASTSASSATSVPVKDPFRTAAASQLLPAASTGESPPRRSRPVAGHGRNCPRRGVRQPPLSLARRPPPPRSPGPPRPSPPPDPDLLHGRRRPRHLRSHRRRSAGASPPASPAPPASLDPTTPASSPQATTAALAGLLDPVERDAPSMRVSRSVAGSSAKQADR